MLDSVGETLVAMDEEKAQIQGVRRIPKAGQIRGLNDESLAKLIADPDTTILERSIYLREYDRRKNEQEWLESVVKGMTDEVKVARSLVVAWLNRFVCGEKTAAQCAWEVSRVLKMTYKDAELVVAGGFGYHDAAGVEVNQNMSSATLSRNTIPPVCAASWMAVFEGTPGSLEELSEAVKTAITTTDPTRVSKRQAKAPREKSQRLTTVGDAVKVKREKAPRAARVKYVLPTLSKEEQDDIMQKFMAGL